MHDDATTCARCADAGIITVIYGDSEWFDLCDCDAAEAYRNRYPREARDIARRAEIASAAAYNARP